MSGKGALERQRIDARYAATLKANGYTTREIAASLNKKPEQIKALVKLGERLLQAAQ